MDAEISSPEIGALMTKAVISGSVIGAVKIIHGCLLLPPTLPYLSNLDNLIGPGFYFRGESGGEGRGTLGVSDPLPLVLA